MRLWTLHPRYLDGKGLVALWREGLLAQAVLSGKTRGYISHPQLDRFRRVQFPVAAIAEYLRQVHVESLCRGYRFDSGRVSRAEQSSVIEVTRGQLEYEWKHLMLKLVKRDPGWHERLKGIVRPQPHPLFRIVPGGVEEWEKKASTSEV